MNSNTERPPGPGAPGGDWWSRRPRRSATDRKIAGVSGGIGRALGVDPVLIRVAFVILTLAGVGILLYLLGWLLLPADRDEVSPAESLLGRGRSATPPILTVGLAIATLISILSTLSWGPPLWVLVVVGCVVVLVARKKARECTAQGRPAPWVDQWSARAAASGRSWGEQAEQWIARQPWSGTNASTTQQPGQTQPGQTQPGQTQSQSPFDRPAFWDETAAAPGRVNLRKDGRPADDAPVTPAPATRQPPAWDPLGAAPFAWDLPEPAPAAPPPAPRRRNVIGRIALGMVLLVGATATVGVVQGWWALTWAGVSALALTIVAVGLLIGSLRGEGRALIAPGIFLSLLTLALTITGISGTSGYGQQAWAPTTVAEANREFVLNGGQGTLDLRRLNLPAGQTVHPTVTVRAGQATVIVPASANVDATCTANAGEVDCLGEKQSGLQQEITAAQDGSSDKGTIDLTVHVGAGQGQVRNG